MNRIPGKCTFVLGVMLAFCTVEANAATTDDLVFIHHSTGRNWLTSSLHAALLTKDYIDERNDIYYGTDVSPDAGRPDSLGSIPGDKTNMDHWVKWFNDYLDGVQSHGSADGVNRVIMFKSCYPISNIGSDGTEPGDPFSSTQSLVNYMSVYRHPSGSGNTYSTGGYTYRPLEDIFAENPDTLFIPVTAPPMNNAGTNDAEGYRARWFNEWLTDDWLDGYNAANPGLNNVAVFDWFDVLANDNDHATWPNRLRAVYGGTTSDSHPNSTANSDSTQVFATNLRNFIDEAWFAFTLDAGDHDGDWRIDGADLAIWQQNYDPLGTHSDTNRWAIGDWNADGRIDGADLALWQQNYDPLGTRGVGGEPIGSLTEVPEPATISLVGLGVAALTLCGRKRRG